MTDPKPTPEKQNSPADPDSETDPTPANKTSPRTTGFFNRVQREIQPEDTHPSEAAEIVITEEGDGDEKTRFR